MSGAVSLGRPSRPPFWKFQWRREQRPDAAAVVAASGLPDAAAAFVLSVVKRCRLWREERVEVARELCAHLGEGLDRGESVEGLIAGFGDARTAARLITRAKRRCRPWWWRAQRDTRRGVGCLLLLGLCWYGYHAAWFYLGRPRVTFSVVSKMNEGSVSVPLEERAWPVYREAYLAFRDAGDVWPKIEGTDRGLLIEIERSLTGTERARVGA
ncbi:MAG: hypothetical protein K2Q09_09500, partial [Phycisphaerales bacterium]|nr:hypothetical protein [Phycisphaerales bacterium]